MNANTTWNGDPLGVVGWQGGSATIETGTSCEGVQGNPATMVPSLDSYMLSLSLESPALSPCAVVFDMRETSMEPLTNEEEIFGKIRLDCGAETLPTTHEDHSAVTGGEGRYREVTSVGFGFDLGIATRQLPDFVYQGEDTLLGQEFGSALIQSPAHLVLQNQSACQIAYSELPSIPWLSRFPSWDDELQMFLPPRHLQTDALRAAPTQSTLSELPSVYQRYRPTPLQQGYFAPNQRHTSTRLQRQPTQPYQRPVSSRPQMVSKPRGLPERSKPSQPTPQATSVPTSRAPFDSQGPVGGVWPS